MFFIGIFKDSGVIELHQHLQPDMVQPEIGGLVETVTIRGEGMCAGAELKMARMVATHMAQTLGADYIDCISGKAGCTCGSAPRDDRMN